MVKIVGRQVRKRPVAPRVFFTFSHHWPTHHIAHVNLAKHKWVTRNTHSRAIEKASLWTPTLNLQASRCMCGRALLFFFLVSPQSGSKPTWDTKRQESKKTPLYLSPQPRESSYHAGGSTYIVCRRCCGLWELVYCNSSAHGLLDLRRERPN